MAEPPGTPAPPPPKRRRLSASSTLKKPFRSPLINRPPSGSSTPPTFSLPTPPSTKSITTSFPPPSENPLPPSPLASKASLSSAKRPLEKSIIRPPRRKSLSLTSAPSDPELAAAQKKHTALLSEIRAAKQSLETVTQAVALEANPQGDEDLVASIRKWRLAARAAADTLFGIAGDKVNQLGGPGGDGWRALMGGGKKSFGWDEEEPKRRNDEDGEDRDEGIGGEDEREEEAKKTDEEWGMGLMLKTFGIPLKMLGWDKEGDCWKSIEEMEQEQT